MKKKIHIAWYNEKLNEGGLARNYAFANYLSQNGFTTLNYYPNNIVKRVINIFKLTRILLTSKKNTIFIHGNFYITNYLVQIFGFHFYVNLVAAILKKASYNNNIIIEINDLRYEQAKDLKNKKVTRKFDENEKKILYDLKNVKYIFASNSMKEYAIKKYKLREENASVIINGGPLLDKNLILKDKFKISNKINYVYAGTLNKGRQIENMINIFENNSKVTLYLLGSGGEWIENENVKENIKYLGPMVEREAHKFVSLCDVGLIPYNQNGFYYNLCYPTKASFYITAGIPFLSTELDELIYIFKQKDICYFKELTEWEIFINEIDKDTINIMKKKVINKSYQFDWEFLLKSLTKLIY